LSSNLPLKAEIKNHNINNYQLTGNALFPVFLSNFETKIVRKFQFFNISDSFNYSSGNESFCSEGKKFFEKLTKWKRGKKTGWVRTSKRSKNDKYGQNW
jgi:hypothetical protein